MDLDLRRTLPDQDVLSIALCAREFACFGYLVIGQWAPPGVSDQRFELA